MGYIVQYFKNYTFLCGFDSIKKGAALCGSGSRNMAKILCAGLERAAGQGS
jgi:hypothetical protein